MTSKYQKCSVKACDGNAYEVADMEYCYPHYLLHECDALTDNQNDYVRNLA